MEQISVATQRAMAAEIRSRLGRMNRTQKWLQDNAPVPQGTWRKYFTEGAISREVPLVTVSRIARTLGMTTGELVAIAERDADQYMTDLPGTTEAEREDLRLAVERNKPRRGRETNSGS
jgi:hypothetical protein